MKLLLIGLCLLIVSCSSRDKRQEEFKNIEIGMVKSEVLDVAGPPYWSDRKNNEDRWIYYMDPEDKDTERIVYLKNNKVVRKGLRELPLLSAEEMEAIKKERPDLKPHKPSVSEEELREIIKKEIEKENPSPKGNFETI